MRWLLLWILFVPLLALPMQACRSTTGDARADAAAARQQIFCYAWFGLFIGGALMLSRSAFIAGAVLAATCFATLTLPMARQEWRRRTEHPGGRAGAAADEPPTPPGR